VAVALLQILSPPLQKIIQGPLSFFHPSLYFPFPFALTACPFFFPSLFPPRFFPLQVDHLNAARFGERLILTLAVNSGAGELTDKYREIVPNVGNLIQKRLFFQSLY